MDLQVISFPKIFIILIDINLPFLVLKRYHGYRVSCASLYQVEA